MKLSEFVQRFPLRSKNISWFFGAGTSAAAGIPTANYMIWDFKRRLYCAEENLDISQYNNLSNPIIRRRIQSYFNTRSEAPKEGDPAEYSFYFERLLTEEKDRAEYISRMVRQARPSYGHKVLAVMMKMNLIQQVITTNFDRTVENAVAQVFGNVDDLYVASIDNNKSANEYLSDQKAPLLLKLHGDYHSKSLLNTTQELKRQDEALRLGLKRICTSQGVAVIGYSGRDESILEVFKDSIHEPNAFPNGLYWFKRSDSTLLPGVAALIREANNIGIDAHVVEAETFDETFGSIIKAFDNIPPKLKYSLSENKSRLETLQVPPSGSKFPVVRFNALPILEYPTVVRIIDCSIGGAAELKEAISKNKAEILAIRKREGVLGFGDDSEFSKALSSYNIKSRSINVIPDHFLNREDSSFHELLLKSICLGLIKDGVFKVSRRRSNFYIFPDIKNLDDNRLKFLNNASYSSYGKLIPHKLTGTVPGTRLKWVDAVQVSLSYHRSSLYLILNPTILSQKTDVKEQGQIAAAFIREQMAKRLNEAYNVLLEAWIKTLFPNQDSGSSTTIEAFSDITGVNATFRINCKTLFSKST